MRIVLLGPPGSGKGTQGRFLAEKFNLPILGMGDLLRAEVASGTALGKQIAPALEKGGFPPSDLVSGILIENLAQHKDFIIDGYPRDVEQAETLDAFLARSNHPLTHAIFFQVKDALLLNRLLNRYTCGTCGALYAKGMKEPRVKGVCDSCGGTTFKQRSDDQEVIAKVRLSHAQARDKIVLEYYEKKGILHKVDGSLNVSQVAQALSHLLSENGNDRGMKG